MAKQAGARSGGPTVPGTDEIPDKLYFRIGEVATLCKVETYVLRFWQTEFPQLKPVKSGTGQRLYRRRDVEMALRIKRLLHDEGYTIAGARQVFAAEAAEHRHPRSQSELPLLSPSGSGDGVLAGETQPVKARDSAERNELLDSADQGDGGGRAADRALACMARLRLELGELYSMLSRAPIARSAARGRGHGHSSSEANLFGDETN